MNTGGVEENLELAIEWYTLAEEQGNEAAHDNLMRLREAAE